MSEEIRDHLTIVVPTYNRYPFLLRLLKYYRSYGTPFPMHILDSSREALVPPALEELVRSIHVLYTKFDPHLVPTAKLFEGLQQVTTPYVVLWADDDLMVPRAFERGVRFLEEHPDFSVAHGHSGLFSAMTTHGQKLGSIFSYTQRSYIQDTASQRFLDYLGNNTSLFYSIQRTQNLQHNLSRCLVLGFGDFHPTQPIHRSDWWVELILGCLSVIQGKTKKMECLYMMREIHAGRDSWEEKENRLDLFDWVTSASFSSAYEKFCTCLSQALVDQDRISLTEAHDVVKHAFWLHLAQTLTRKWPPGHMQDGSREHSRLRRMLRCIPGLRSAWRAARSLIPGKKDEMSLTALLRPSSPYHADFMPIYRAITGSPDLSDDNATPG